MTLDELAVAFWLLLSRAERDRSQVGPPLRAMVRLGRRIDGGQKLSAKIEEKRSELIVEFSRLRSEIERTIVADESAAKERLGEKSA